MIKYIFLLALMLAGCESVQTCVRPAAPIHQNIPGIYHRVAAGQTLWKISKIYNVDLDDIIKLNQLSEDKKIEIGQMIFIPGRSLHREEAIKSDNDDFTWPLKGRVVSNFGSNYHNLMNKGINLVPYSATDVFAARSGKVVFYCGSLGNFGKTIIIDHGDGLRSVYSRNSEVYAKAGDLVKKGDLIAKAGSAGRDRNVYLHFEIRKGSNPQNPLFYLP